MDLTQYVVDKSCQRLVKRHSIYLFIYLIIIYLFIYLAPLHICFVPFMRVQIILGSLVIPHATRTNLNRPQASPLKRPQASEIFYTMSDVVSDNHVQKIRFSNSLLFMVVLTP